MTNVRFASEPFSDALLAEMLPLAVQHWKEVAHYPDIPLEVDAAVYHAADERGALRIYTVRQDEAVELPPDFDRDVAHLRKFVDMAACGPDPRAAVDRIEIGVKRRTLLGYAFYFVRANPHYASSVQAVQDVIYLAPAIRGGTGARFIAWCDLQLQSEGVQAVYHHVKVAHNWGKLLERMGYEAVDVIYAKRLDVKAEG